MALEGSTASPTRPRVSPGDDHEDMEVPRWAQTAGELDGRVSVVIAAEK